MKDITHNPGLLPVNLGAAKLQQSSHTFIHYYDVSPLDAEFQDLNDQHKELARVVSIENSYTTELANYDKVIRYLQEKINDKLNGIYYRHPKRTRRGLYNGLGTIAKGITGLLDDNDGQRIDQVLGLLQTNEHTLEKQIEMQYTINNNIIQEFNRTVKNLEHNEQLLHNRINELTDIIEEEFEAADVLIAKDLFNQLIILYNAILNILQEIENSLTFCYLKTYHPSILNTEDLFRELEKISTHYGRQLPMELKMENIPDFQRLLSVDCRIEDKKIIYLLSMPINFDIDFDLFYLLPIPSKVEEGYVTILPNNKYFLRSKNLVKSLGKPCTLYTSAFQCPNNALSTIAEECEANLLQNENTKLCQYVNLEIIKNYLEIVPEINQLLGVFIEEELVQFQCLDGIENRNLKGIFLIEQNDCKVVFRNEIIEFEQKSKGKPYLFDHVKLINFNVSLPRSKIVLRNLKLDEISPNQIQPLEAKPDFVNNMFSLVFKFFSASSFTILLGYISYLGLRKVRDTRLSLQESQAYPDVRQMV